MRLGSSLLADFYFCLGFFTRLPLPSAASRSDLHSLANLVVYAVRNQLTRVQIPLAARPEEENVSEMLPYAAARREEFQCNLQDARAILPKSKRSPKNARRSARNRVVNADELPSANRT